MCKYLCFFNIYYYYYLLLGLLIILQDLVLVETFRYGANQQSAANFIFLITVYKLLVALFLLSLKVII